MTGVALRALQAGRAVPVPQVVLRARASGVRVADDRETPQVKAAATVARTAAGLTAARTAGVPTAVMAVGTPAVPPGVGAPTAATAEVP